MSAEETVKELMVGTVEAVPPRDGTKVFVQHSQPTRMIQMPHDELMESRWGVTADVADADATPLDGFLSGSDSVAAVVVTRDGTVVEANTAFGRLLGPTVSIDDVVVAAHGAVVTELLAGAGTLWRWVQAGMLRPSGEMVDCKVWALTEDDDVLVLIETLRSPGEKLNALLLELNDDLLAARRELAATNRRLRELDELKSMFLASATHDLKTPLTSILGYAEMLGEQGLAPEARRMSQTIENSAHRALTMMNDLLGAAQIMTGELQLERSQTDLMAVARRAVEAIQPGARASRVTISLHGPESAVALVDEGRVLQILDNLLSNAVKYCRQGGHVDIVCEPRGTDISIVVTDTGIGIPLEEQHELFARYFRASTAVELGIPGTGLGLANARAFAEAHQGTLECTSEPGVGSTFTLVLPGVSMDS